VTLKINDETTPLSERKVVRRGMLAGLASLGAIALMHVKGSPGAEALDPQDIDMNTTNVSSAATILNSAVAGGSGYTVLRVENFRIADAIEAVGGPGSLGNAGGRGVNATGGSNSAGTFGLPTNAGDAILATGGNTLTGVGNGGKGVKGQGGAAGSGTGGTGVEGQGGSPAGIGVRGFGGGTSGSQGSGVSGSTNSSNAGVQGNNSGSGPGVRGDSGNGPGVHGSSTNSLGVRGTSANFVGVVGISDTSHGLYGSSSNPSGAGLVGENLSGGVAGFFYGDVQIYGSLKVFGAPKNAVLKMQDGTFASVYCQESPEPYFEDFGRARLAGGMANVALEPEFAGLVNGSDYMVFLTPSGDTRGLYVAKQDSRGFEVRETQGGTGSLGFTYRVVTKRKDIEGRRFARVSTAAGEKVAGVRAVLAGMGAAGPTSGPSSPLPPQQAVPPIFTNTPPVIPGGTSYTNTPPGAP